MTVSDGKLPMQVSCGGAAARALPLLVFNFGAVLVTSDVCAACEHAAGACKQLAQLARGQQLAWPPQVSITVQESGHQVAAAIL